MLDTKSIELINAAVDGELDVAGQNQLDELLESSSEARELHSELLRLSNFLDALPPQHPPSGLSDQILGQIRLPKQLSRFSPRYWLNPLRPLAMAAAFSAGLMLAVGFYELGPQHGSQHDVNQMMGAAISKSARSSTGIQERVELQETWLAGTVALKENRGLFLLEFDMDSEDPVEISFMLAEAGMRFAGIAQEAAGPNSVNETIHVSGGTVQVENQGKQSFVVYIRKTDDWVDGQTLDIEFSSGDSRIVKTLLGSS